MVLFFLALLGSLLFYASLTTVGARNNPARLQMWLKWGKWLLPLPYLFVAVGLVTFFVTLRNAVRLMYENLALAHNFDILVYLFAIPVVVIFFALYAFITCMVICPRQDKPAVDV